MCKVYWKAVLAAAMMFCLSGCNPGSSEGNIENETEIVTATATVQEGTLIDIQYYSEFAEIDWDAEWLSCGFADENGIGTIGWHSVSEEDQKTHREYIMATVGSGEDAADVTKLQIPDNWSVREAASRGDWVYFLANEVATKENPHAAGRYLAACSQDGMLVFQKSLDEIVKMEGAQFSSMTLDKSGNVWLLEILSNGIYCFSPEKETIKQIEGNGERIEGFVLDKNQNIYGKSSDEMGNWKLWRIDAEEGLSAAPLMLEEMQIIDMKAGTSTDFLLLKENQLVGYDIASQEQRVICSLTDMGIQIGDIYDFAEMDNGDMGILLAALGAADSSIAWIKPKEMTEQERDGQQNGTITVACLEADGMLRDMVAAFNRSGSDYTAIIKEYYDPYQADAAKEDALKRLNADLADGTAGDVLDLVGLTGYAVRRQYVELGILEEIYSWIDNDADIVKEDYLQSLWKANEIESGLYNLVSLYDVNTKIGAENHIDLEWMLSQEESVKVFGTHYIREEFFHDICVFLLSDYKNIESSVLYDTEIMQKILVFAKALPEERDEIWGIQNSDELYFDEMLLQTTGWDYGDGIKRDLSAYRYVAAALGSKETGTVDLAPLLMQMGDSFTQEDAVTLGSFAGDVAMVGFPVQNGTGSSFVSRVSLGMCKASKNKEGAWELLKYTLSDEAQRSRGEFEQNCIPAKNSIWKEICENNCAAENIRVTWIGSVLPDKEYEVLVPPLSQEMVDDFNRLTAQMTYVDEIDPQLYRILLEEAGLYFQGQCSEMAAVQAIQNRVRIYLSEKGM